MQKLVILFMAVLFISAEKSVQDQCIKMSSEIMDNPEMFISMVRSNSNKIHALYYDFIDNSNRNRKLSSIDLTYEEEFAELIKKTIKNEYKGEYHFNDIMEFSQPGTEIPNIRVTFTSNATNWFGIEFLFQEENGQWKLYFVKFNDDRKCNGRGIE